MSHASSTQKRGSLIPVGPTTSEGLRQSSPLSAGRGKDGESNPRRNRGRIFPGISVQQELDESPFGYSARAPPGWGHFFAKSLGWPLHSRRISSKLFLSPDWLGLVVLINTAVVAPLPNRRSETGMAASDADQRDKARRQRGNNSGRDLVSEQAWSQFQYLFARSSSPTTIAPMADSSTLPAAISLMTRIFG